MLLFRVLQQFYNYKIGIWTYYFNNGRIRAVGEYVTTNLHIDTSCEGGDNLIFGVMTKNWKFYDKNDKPIQFTDSLRTQFEMIRTNGNTLADYFYPDSEKINIKMKFEN